MNSIVGIGMRYGIEREKNRVRGGVEMIGRGELWHTKEEEICKLLKVSSVAS